MFIHSPVGKEQGRKNVLLFTFRLHIFPMFDDGLAIGELLQYSLQGLRRLLKEILLNLFLWSYGIDLMVHDVNEISGQA